MRFLCLAYGSEKDWRALPRAEQDALLAQDEILRQRGALMGAVESKSPPSGLGVEHLKRRRSRFPNSTCLRRGS